MRRVVLVLVAGLAALLAAGCGGSGTDEGASTPESRPSGGGVGAASQDTTGRWQLVAARGGLLGLAEGACTGWAASGRQRDRLPS